MVDEDNGAGSGAGTSLREAIAAASAGDDIQFSVTGTIELTLGEIAIGTDLSIFGPGADQVIIEQTGNDRIFTTTANVDIVDVTLRGGDLTGKTGSAADGGAIYNTGNLLLSGVELVNNHAARNGGAVYSHSNVIEFTMTDTLVFGNTADGDGGGLYNLYDMFLENSTVFGNSAQGSGGGIYNGFDSLLETRSTTIAGNTADSDNNSSGEGGGIYSQNDDYALAFFNTIVATNVRGDLSADDIRGDISDPEDDEGFNNLIGVDRGLTGISNGSDGNQIGTTATPLDPQFNGGLRDLGGADAHLGAARHQPSDRCRRQLVHPTGQGRPGR